MIVGDSGMFTAAPSLIAALRDAGWSVVDTAYPGMGLTRPDGVRATWRDNAQRYDVDLTIAMLGGWDASFVEARGADAYRTVIDESVAAFTAAGGKVLWLGVLPGGWRDERPMNRFYRALPERYPGVVEFLDIESALRAPTGGWPQVVNGRRLRGPDGWHLCQDGALAITRMALAHVGLDRGGWDGGVWRADPRN
jgi:hypothetical protein